MNIDVVKKTCRMCWMDIPKEARKCPYCHHFQNRLSMILYHPAFAVLFACLPMAAMLIVFATIFDRGENYEGYKDQIVIQDSQIVFGDTKSAATVAVLGMIKNTSPVPWKEIQFHADFLDAEGRRADVGEKEEYSLYLPPSATSSFKVSFRREFPETNYVKHTIRVVAAKDARARW
jgi:ribosomal protein L40E